MQLEHAMRVLVALIAASTGGCVLWFDDGLQASYSPDADGGDAGDAVDNGGDARDDQGRTPPPDTGRSDALDDGGDARDDDIGDARDDDGGDARDDDGDAARTADVPDDSDIRDDTTRDDGGTDVCSDDVCVDVGDGGEIGPVCPPPMPDGDYLCALSTSLDRAAPLYMRVTFTVSDGVLATDAQLIASDELPNDEPRPEARTDVGDPLPRITQPLGDDGAFTLQYDNIEVRGEANPLIFATIRCNLLLVGRFYDDAIAYGSMGGEVLEPVNLLLDNSTFACQRADDMRDVDPVYHDDTIAELVELCE